MLEEMVAEVTHRRDAVEVGPGKELPDVVGADFAAVRVGVLLHDTRELDLEAARHDHAVLGFHEVGDTALA